MHATSNKATSSFSYTLSMSKCSTTYVSDHLYRKTTFVLQLFHISFSLMYVNPTLQPCIAKTKRFVGRQMCCKWNHHNMSLLYIKVKSHHSILTYIGLLNAIYSHGCFGTMDFLKNNIMFISAAEALVHGPILII